jgi:hypothetical protein
MLKRALLLSVGLSFCINCGGNNPSGPSVTASETWRLLDVATNYHLDITLYKLSNGAVSASGSTQFNYFGDIISCAFSNGTAVIIDTSVTIEGRGIASYMTKSSAFDLIVSGTFRDSAAHGTWRVTFTDTSWNGWVGPGSFTGQMQSGGGVTSLR